jgi:hypothetical protein
MSPGPWPVPRATGDWRVPWRLLDDRAQRATGASVRKKGHNGQIRKSPPFSSSSPRRRIRVRFRHLLPRHRHRPAKAELTCRRHSQRPRNAPPSPPAPYLLRLPIVEFTDPTGATDAGRGRELHVVGSGGAGNHHARSAPDQRPAFAELVYFLPHSAASATCARSRSRDRPGATDSGRGRELHVVGSGEALATTTPDQRLISAPPLPNWSTSFPIRPLPPLALAAEVEIAQALQRTRYRRMSQVVDAGPVCAAVDAAYGQHLCYHTHCRALCCFGACQIPGLCSPTRLL